MMISKHKIITKSLFVVCGLFVGSLGHAVPVIVPYFPSQIKVPSAADLKNSRAQQANARTDKNKIAEVPFCLSSHQENQCGYKTACKWVCPTVAAGAGFPFGMAGAAIGGGVGAQGCENICEQVENCHDVDVCDRWSTDPGDNDDTGNGHGTDDNYDHGGGYYDGE